MKPIFISGNTNKAHYLSKWLGIELDHRAVDQPEIQSLDLKEVVTHKALTAYEFVQQPVLVEDVSLRFTAMGRLPGTFIKWFIEEVGLDGLCHVASTLEHNEAEASILYALYDGTSMHYFGDTQRGTIPQLPRGDASFGWNPIFIPNGATQTYGEMDDATFAEWNIRSHAVAKLREYLTTGDQNGRK